MSSGYFLVDPKTGTRHPLDRDTTIGRTTGEILLPADMRVSSKHCKISFTPMGPTIEDLKSSNGTSVNGAKLAPNQPMLLQPGAQISLGNTTFELVNEIPAPAPVPPMPAPAPPPPMAAPEAENKFSPTRLLGLLLVVGAGVLAALALKQKPKTAKKKAPTTIEETAALPTTIDLYMQTSSEDFDRLTTSYAKLIDAANADGNKEAAIIEIKTGLEPLCRRLLDETRKIKPATESDRVYINLHQKILFAMHQHMTQTTSFWETNDPALEKEATKSLAEYLEASRQMRLYLENR